MHGDPELHLLRVARQVQPCDARAACRAGRSRSRADGARNSAPGCCPRDSLRDTRLRVMTHSMKGAHMTVKRRWLVLASLVAVATTTAALVAASTGGARSGKASGSITVWVDAVRLPVAKLYTK